MGKLDGACGYLSGPMEAVADHGVEWRRKFVKLIDESELNIDLIDPTNKPGGIDVKIGENKAHQETLQREGRWNELRRYVKAYRRYDLRFVDISDFLVVVVNPAVPQWGTANEVYTAEQQHKPMFFICDGGMANLPRWLFDVVDLDDASRNKQCNVFQSVEEVIERLIHLDSGKYPLNDEWVLIRKNLENQRLESILTPV
jgi:hypothetical protein